MNKQKIGLFILSIILLTGVKATPISKEFARKIANQVIEMRGKQSLSINYTEPSQQARQRVKIQNNTDNYEPLYIFNVGNNNGFIVVSGDDYAPTVLGYADEGSFSWDNIPDNMAVWLEMNAVYIDNVSKGGASQSVKKMPGSPVVEPLLGQIVWGQDEPFNAMCPTYTDEGKTINYYVGCVATAATQIMYYHKYPNQGEGSKTYTMKGQTLTANFGNTIYEWDKMVPDYRNTATTQEQDDAVATLAYHFGVAVEMMYEKNGSGASSVLVPIALRDYFRYSPDVVMVKRDFFSSADWMKLITTELDNRRPVYYGATSEVGMSGHAFVCDGYDDAGYVHINWGWYGKSNGYFLVNHLDPDYLGEGGGTGGFNRNQEVVINIQPSTDSRPTQKYPMVYAASRLSCSSFGSDFMLMSFVENYDNSQFNGKIAAVLTKDKQIVKVLHEENLTIDGIKDNKTGYTSITLKDITTSVGDVPEGNYEIRLAVKGGNISDWMLLLHPKGYADHATASVISGQLMNIEQVYLHPDVKLLKQLSPEGEVFAKGSALFKVKLENRSTNFMLQKVVMRFINADDEQKVYETEHHLNIYDSATEQIDIVVLLNEEMTEGKYFCTMYEKGHEDYPFDDSEVGTGKFYLLPAKTSPYLRMNTAPIWSSQQGDTEQIEQGELVNILVNVRNYGAAGEATAIARLTDIDDPSKTYIFRQTSINIDKAKSGNLIFSRRIPVDPGTYKVEISYLEEEGKERVDDSFIDSPTIIKVVKNETNELLQIVDFQLPDILEQDKQVEGSLRLASDKGFSGNVYVRIRPYTLLQGELAWMGNATIQAGNQAEVTFKYSPSLNPGKYLVMIEGNTGSAECTVGNYAKGYRLIEIVSDITSIEKTVTDDINSNTPLINVISGQGYIDVMLSKASNISIYSADGSLVKTVYGFDLTNRITLPRGIYIVRIEDSVNAIRTVVK